MQGAWIETANYIKSIINKGELSSEFANKLKTLNIPYVQIGKTVTVSGDILHNGSPVIENVKMPVAFYATRDNTKPQIWLSESVTGNIVGTPAKEDSGTLIGSADSNNKLNLQFKIINWDSTNNKWMAGIQSNEGKNVINGQNIEYRGIAAGSINGSKIEGTASGVVTK